MPTMTDAALLAALGWQPCEPDVDGVGLTGSIVENSHKLCAIHDVWLGADTYCVRMRAQLIGARAGIDLARDGIAEAIEAQRRDETGDSGPSDDFYGCAAEIAQGWAV